MSAYGAPVPDAHTVAKIDAEFVDFGINETRSCVA